jgi:hypothetical protein
LGVLAVKENTDFSEQQKSFPLDFQRCMLFFPHMEPIRPFLKGGNSNMLPVTTNSSSPRFLCDVQFSHGGLEQDHLLCWSINEKCSGLHPKPEI